MDDLEDLAPMKLMEKSYHKTAFPCDTDVIFHGTVIYAKPEDRNIVKSQEEEGPESTSESPVTEEKKTQNSVEEDLSSKLAATKID